MMIDAPPLRVALLTPEFPGCGAAFGVGAYVAALTTALTAAGCSVRIAVVASAGCFTVLPGEAPRLQRRAFTPAALRPALASAWLARQLREWEPQVVEYPNWGGLGALLDGPWPRVVRLSTPVGVIRPRDALRAVSRPLHQLWERHSVQHARLVIANSRAMAELGERCYGRPSDLVIPHAWTGGVAAPVETGDEVLYVGRLEQRKGVDLLLAAWRVLHARLPQARLHLVGADQADFGARALAQWGSAGVHVHGRLDDHGLAALRRRCRVQVIPSRFESFGLVALEAWAGGAAVVAAAAGGLAEVVGEAGVLVPPGESGALTEALLALLGDRLGCRRLVELGQRRLESCFGMRAWSTATLAAYRRALLRTHAREAT